MSFSYVVDKDGCLDVVVSRWYNGQGNKEVRLRAEGFEPFEPVTVEVLSEDIKLARMPFRKKGVEQ